jgi:formylglycine-generating enzyme
MKTPTKQVLLMSAMLLGGMPVAQATVNIEISIVGNAGNAADTTTYGAVAYTYGIGTKDVTVSQYTEFLNAVARTDTYSLYNTSMASNLNSAGITRGGSLGTYTYSVISGMGNHPITYVSWFDAARFTNWLSNGQGSGSTETGAYTLGGATSGVAVTNNGSGQYWIPSENEWYKAAYHKNDGVAGNYWSYATQSNSAPGNVVGAAVNQANYYDGTKYSVTQSSYSSTQNYLTDVGAFSGSGSAYGTFDQNGNVFNWDDGIIAGSSRGLCGGSWAYGSNYLQSSGRNFGGPSNEFDSVGFRVATVPEPTSALLMTFGVFVVACRRSKPFKL